MEPIDMQGQMSGEFVPGGAWVRRALLSRRSSSRHLIAERLDPVGNR